MAERKREGAFFQYLVLQRWDLKIIAWSLIHYFIFFVCYIFSLLSHLNSSNVFFSNLTWFMAWTNTVIWTVFFISRIYHLNQFILSVCDVYFVQLRIKSKALWLSNLIFLYFVNILSLLGTCIKFSMSILCLTQSC